MAAAFIPETNDELWRECAVWLTRWDMLRPDHKANWPNSNIADLANILRDGVLLCKLVNKIEPGCIDMKDVNLKPTLAQFLCLRNINLFLKACRENFGICNSDIFEATMLFDLTNFHKVLCTLSRLSVCQKATRSGIQGFLAHKVKTKEEDVIYQSLKAVTVRGPCRNSSWTMFEIPCPNVESDEDIYEDLCYVTFKPRFIEPPVHRSLEIIESESGITQEEIYQDLLVVRYNIEQPPPLEKRDFVIKELLDTEKNYVDVLSKLNMSFMIPLTNQMKAEDHSCVFHKIKELHEIHLSFLLELTRMKTNPNIKLSNVFLQFRDKFLIYGSYCANLTKATTLLQELCDQDEIFNQAVVRYEKEVNNGRFKLRDVLSVPMQRILKYHLLLEKLIENTDVNHDEYPDLRKAREAMLDVAGYINEAARDVEHLNVINNLQENIVEWDYRDPDIKLSDYGKLIKDAELKIKAHDDQKTRSRYVFIFDKCILICKQLKSNQFAFRNILSIMEYHIEDTHNRASLSKDARWSYNFLLVQNGQQMAYTIFVRSLEIKQQIIKAINDAIDNVQPKALTRTKHHFEIRTFQTPVQCGYCYKYLKGLIFQGYFCSVCNFCAHKDCIQFSGKCGVPSRPSSHIANGVNDRDPLRDRLWYVGEMDRDTAEEKLANRENGTFLVRIRPKTDRDIYALTLKTDDSIKHMKICSTADGSEDSKKYYLSQSRFFNSIEELVLNYENFSLNENFAKLDDNTLLVYPFYQLKAIVLRKYDAQDKSQLSIREGQVLRVIGKEGYREGWWKGKNDVNGEVGYFPISLIKIDGEVRF